MSFANSRHEVSKRACKNEIIQLFDQNDKKKNRKTAIHAVITLKLLFSKDIIFKSFIIVQKYDAKIR